MHATITFVPRQRDLFGESAERSALTTPEVDAAIEAHAPCFIDVSGGCDSQEPAHRTIEHLDAAGHRGPRDLIRAELGCRRAGDLMERWLSRWAAQCERYRKLEGVCPIVKNKRNSH